MNIMAKLNKITNADIAQTAAKHYYPTRAERRVRTRLLTETRGDIMTPEEAFQAGYSRMGLRWLGDRYAVTAKEGIALNWQLFKEYMNNKIFKATVL